MERRWKGVMVKGLIGGMHRSTHKLCTTAVAASHMDGKIFNMDRMHTVQLCLITLCQHNA